MNLVEMFKAASIDSERFKKNILAAAETTIPLLQEAAKLAEESEEE